jgi:hypothetical protein
MRYIEYSGPREDVIAGRQIESGAGRGDTDDFTIAAGNPDCDCPRTHLDHLNVLRPGETEITKKTFDAHVVTLEAHNLEKVDIPNFTADLVVAELWVSEVESDLAELATDQVTAKAVKNVARRQANREKGIAEGRVTVLASSIERARARLAEIQG